MLRLATDAEAFKKDGKASTEGLQKGWQSLV